MTESIVLFLLVGACLLSLGALAAALWAAFRARREALITSRRVERARAELLEGQRLDAAQQEAARQTLSDALGRADASMHALREELRATVSDGFRHTDARLSANAAETANQLAAIRVSVENQLSSVREDSGRRLDEMRRVVDEKLQKTLDERMTQSFSLVNQRLEEVYKAMGEMQSLAQGVGDLKKVLTNVKSRGILGEVQLGAILDEILAPEQYDVNVKVNPASAQEVEFAVKLPAGDGFVYMPIDSKFPGDSYQNLLSAYDSGDKARVDAAADKLLSTVRQEARDIAEKYICPPHTTDFGVMFLPFEGLYAEVVNRGMVERLQREYRVNVAGPSTMAALLNSLQMGFRSVALQKQSDEVRKVLFSVRAEFDKFAEALYKAQDRINRAGEELDSLVGARTRMLRKQLRQVDSLTQYGHREDE